MGGGGYVARGGWLTIAMKFFKNPEIPKSSTRFVGPARPVCPHIQPRTTQDIMSNTFLNNFKQTNLEKHLRNLANHLSYVCMIYIYIYACQKCMYKYIYLNTYVYKMINIYLNTYVYKMINIYSKSG